MPGWAESIGSAGTARPVPRNPWPVFHLSVILGSTNHWDNSAREVLIAKSSPNPCGSRCGGVVAEP